MTCSSKIVVFDLDETLGYFMELGMFWDALKGYINNKNLKIKIDQELFNNILDLYPEFLRPNIKGILNNLNKNINFVGKVNCLVLKAKKNFNFEKKIYEKSNIPPDCINLLFVFISTSRKNRYKKND